MALNVTFYQSANWNTSSTPDTNTVGGAIAGTTVGATLSDVFPEGVSDYIGQDARLRFQKIFITAGTAITNPKVFLNNVKHPGQIQIAIGGATDSHANPTGYPVSSGNFIEPIGIVNATSMGIPDLGATESFSLWIKQSIPANLPSEVGASTTIGIIGEV